MYIYLKAVLKVFGILLSGLFIMLIVLAAFNHNFDGYCEDEGRILSDKELFEIAAGNTYKMNPNCCKLEDSYYFGDKTNDFLNRLLFGNHNRGLTVYRNRENANRDYDVKYYAINQCGKIVDSSGEELSEQTYREEIDKIKQNRK